MNAAKRLAICSMLALLPGILARGEVPQEKPMKKIELAAIVPASAGEVWKAWTTPEGTATFFAPAARIGMRLEGPYEMLFAPGMPVGSQGSDGCKVLSFLPGKMLSFTWNAPPRFPEIRNGVEHTFVVIQLDALSDRKTKVTLTHLGWKEGGQWDEVFAYFEKAWALVLGRLAHRFETGPIDWKNPWTPGAPDQAK
jgi:uncharacterized protein YndB with AHSA1/START domain